MTDYTIKNLKTDIEDMAPKFGMSPEIEARFAREPLGCRKLGVSYERLAPGARSRFGHRHREQEEVYVVVDGGGRAKLDDEVHELNAWDALRVAPETMRAFEAGPDGLAMLIVGAPKTEQRDGELVEGWWSD